MCHSQRQLILYPFQLIQNGGKWKCVDWADVAGMALVGAVAPSGLASAKSAWRSYKAAKTIKSQIQKARTINRLSKLRGRFRNHAVNIRNEIVTQGLIAGGKYGTVQTFVSAPDS